MISRLAIVQEELCNKSRESRIWNLRMNSIKASFEHLELNSIPFSGEITTSR